jgi:hypothetical protein
MDEGGYGMISWIAGVTGAGHSVWGTAEPGARVLRGGSWNNDNPGNFRCANRNNNTPDNRNNNNGFRCASALSAGVPISTEVGRAQERVQATSRLGARAPRSAEYRRGAGSLVAIGERFPAPIPRREVACTLPMRRSGGLIEQIASFENLLWAAARARRGKKRRPDVAAFHVDLESNLLALRDELRGGGYMPGAHRVFSIRDPKPRVISAAPYRDRVAHHAVCRYVGPALERGLIHDCYANRVGKGTHAALDRCTHFARRNRYVLKCDIARYFPSMDRAMLKGQLRHALKCGPTLVILDRIIDMAEPGPDVPVYFHGDHLLAPYERVRGVPIGNLTSQLFGNSYLSAFDHWVKEGLGATAYLRFVDDFLLFSDDKAWLAEARRRLGGELAGLRLQLHPRKCQIVPTQCGVEFLGWHVYPDHRRLKRKTGVRFSRRLRGLVQGYREGRIDREEVRASVMSWIGHLRHGDTWGLRTALLEKAVFVRGEPGDNA